RRGAVRSITATGVQPRLLAAPGSCPGAPGRNGLVRGFLDAVQPVEGPLEPMGDRGHDRRLRPIGVDEGGWKGSEETAQRALDAGSPGFRRGSDPPEDVFVRRTPCVAGFAPPAHRVLTTLAVIP